MTKKESNMVRSYEYAYGRGYGSVLVAYDRPSSAKIAAEEAIKREMNELDGYGYYICGHNSCFFSCGYKYRDADGVEHLVYHTYANRFDIKLD